jgi:hypothetical protein
MKSKNIINHQSEQEGVAFYRPPSNPFLVNHKLRSSVMCVEDEAVKSLNAED